MSPEQASAELRRETRCPACREEVSADDLFCEACGAELPVVPGAAHAAESEATPCAACGAAATEIADGYCGVCGMKQPAPHDHEELTVPGAFAITDRGARHARNEDAVALAARDDGTLVVVLCDGVSSTVTPEQASAAAVAAAMEVLLDRPIASDDEAASALRAAHMAAREAVVRVRYTPSGDLGPPSTTFVAAVVRPSAHVTVANVGDCRAYHLPPPPAAEVVLTDDHSWAAEQVADGSMDALDAQADQRAHMITRWLGNDADPAWEPAITALEPSSGRLLLCSDGLWNYTLEPGRLAEACAGEDTSLEATARRLVQLAYEGGASDNISLALVELPLRSDDQEKGT